MGLIDRMLGGGRAGGAEPAWLKELARGFEAFDPKQARARGLPERILAYVADGSGEAVIGDLAGSGMSEFFGLSGYVMERGGAQRYAGFEEAPAAMRLRWARVLEASVANSQLATWGLQLAPGLHWLEALVLHAAGRALHVWSGDEPGRIPALTVAGLEGMLEEAGAPPETLVAAALVKPVQANWCFEQRARMLAALDGFAAALLRHQASVRQALLLPEAERRLHALAVLGRADAHVQRAFAIELAELAVSASKQVRALAEPMLRGSGVDAVAPLRHWAAKGKPAERLHALELLWTLAADLGDETLAVWAREAAAADKAPSVRALPTDWASRVEQAQSGTGRYEYEVPVPDWSGAMTPRFEALLRELVEEANREVEKANRQYAEWHAQNGGRFKLREDAAYTAEQVEGLLAHVASDSPAVAGDGAGRRQVHWRYISPKLQRLAGQEGVGVPGMLKAMDYFHMLVDGSRGLSTPGVAVVHALHEAGGGPTLLELSERLTAMGHDGPAVVSGAYCYTWNPLARDWGDGEAWPFFAHHLDLLLQRLGPAQPRDYWFDRQGLFRAVRTLPSLPGALVGLLFDLALGTGKTERLPAQEALHALPGKEARIIQALSDGKSEVRAVAAQWLARLEHAPAVPALEQALAREKQDVTKGALLDALEALGQPVEKYLDRSALAGEAAKSLAKGLPKELAWLPWEALPEVCWADSGEHVPADVLRWMLAQAVRQKAPEPNAVLRKYCAMMEPRGREAFGQFLLETWLAEDVRPIPPDEAMQRAKDQAALIHADMQNNPLYYQDDPKSGKSVEELTVAFLPGFLRQPVGSAIGSKGLLAVVAACAGGGAAPVVARYLKEHYGSRAAQGKALIGMLAWIGHPSATQLMLAIGSRFRTRSFQEEATRQAAALAERKGWSLAELSDRTIPTGGFDEDGVMELDYGARRFTARLLPDFRVELANPEGKAIASLPAPRRDDDEALAKDAKKAFQAGKKQLKEIVALQSDRLYEALCTGRDWSFGDWDDYLNRHPVVRHLVQRLVWLASDADETLLAVFRPLDDGSLSDQADGAVELPREARVRIAHDSNLSAADVEAWQQHLVDYEVAPLFQQFGKGSYELPADRGKATAIEDFEGHLLEAFSLRGRAAKLGWTRGPAEDGGWFMTYEKRFPTLGLVAVIEFTGNPLPEQNRTVALIKLSFEAVQGQAWERSTLPLSGIPPVLLSECWNDLRLVAAEGSGFDADWRKKTEY